jgi:hypothetical protein
MAVAAVNSQLIDMMLVTEGDRLFEGNIFPGAIGRSNQEIDQRAQANQKENTSKDRHPGDRVHARMESLVHRRTLA